MDAVLGGEGDVGVVGRGQALAAQQRRQTRIQLHNNTAERTGHGKKGTERMGCKGLFVFAGDGCKHGSYKIASKCLPVTGCAVRGLRWAPAVHTNCPAVSRSCHGGVAGGGMAVGAVS